MASSAKVKRVTKKTAMESPIGSYYHPTEKSIRQGRCPVGQVMKEGYYRHSYKKKSGTEVKGKYVKQACIPNKGMVGKVLPSAKAIPKLQKGELTKYGYSTHKNEKERLQSLIQAVKELSYATVIRKLNAVRTLSKSDAKLFKIYSKDIENLQKWRVQHPEAS
jgi:hypothetical protein